MFSKRGTRILVIVAITLLLVYWAVGELSIRAKDRSFPENVVEVDTAQVVTIALRQPSDTTVTLQRTSKGWTVGMDERNFVADPALVQAFLGRFAALRTKRFVGGGEQVRQRYSLADTSRILLEMEMAKGGTTQVGIGMNSFGMGGQDPTTYLHIPGEEQVYAVEGALRVEAGRNVNEWRPSSLVNGTLEDLRRLDFRFPTDTGYVLLRQGEIWMVDSVVGDKERIERFLTSLLNVSSQRFADDIQVDGRIPGYSLTVESETRPPVVIKVFAVDGNYYATTSDQPGDVRTFDAYRELPRLFRPRTAYLPLVAVDPHAGHDHP